MTTEHSNLEKMFRIAPALLDTVHSIVEFLGPYDDEHPATVKITEQVTADLDDVAAKAARKLERAEARLFDTEFLFGGKDEPPDILDRRRRRTQELVDARRRAILPAMRAARSELSKAWLDDQLSRLRELRDAVSEFVADAYRVLPGIGGHGLVTIWHTPHTSACSAACEVATRLLDDDDLRKNVHALWDWSHHIDYSGIRAKIECELAAVRRDAPHLATKPSQTAARMPKRVNLFYAVLEALEQAGPSGIPTLEALAVAAGYQPDSVRQKRKAMDPWMTQATLESGDKAWVITEKGREQLKLMRAQ